MWITYILFIIITYILIKLSLFHFCLDQFKLENIQHQYLPLIISYFDHNVDPKFLYQLFRWVFLHSISLTLYSFLMHYHEKIISSLPIFHWTKNPNTSKMKWQFFYCENIKCVMKDINKYLVQNKTFLRHNSSSFIFVLYIIT